MSDRQSPTARPVPPIRQAPQTPVPGGIRRGEGSKGDAKTIVQRPAQVPTTPSGPL